MPVPVRTEPRQYDTAQLDPLGQRILECLQDGGRLEDFEKLMPSADRLA